MVENELLRANSRKQLGGNIFAEVWLFCMLAAIIISAIVGALSFTAVGAIIVSGPLAYGLSRLHIDLVKGKRADLSRLFCGFTEAFGTSCVLYLLETVFCALWSMLFVIPGIVKAYSYALSTYILQDDPSKDWQTCHNESIELMRGYKMKLFLLDLSFIGWYLLGALCFGIGVIFVVPYHNQARANFYMARVALCPQNTAAPMGENDCASFGENA